MSFEITVLGSCSALPTIKKFPSAHAVNIHERFFLIDCGEGTQIQLRRFKVKFSSINHIFITHLHGDHFFGLFGLISSFGLLGRTNDLHIYSPGNLEKTVCSVIRKKDIPYNIFFHQLKYSEKAVIYESKSVKISCFPLNHRIESYGFIFEEKPKQRNIIKEMIPRYDLSIKDILQIKDGKDHITKEGKIISNKELSIAPYKVRSYAYCTDTMYHEDIITYIKNVDFMYHEATFAEDLKEVAEQTKHSTSVDAATIAKKVKAGTLLIGHFSSRYKSYELILNEAQAIFKNTIAVNDGDVYKIPLVREEE
ncbi:MAG: ribonuclease Z [Bacteroidales bacterium]|nr:ribonuclease Z [Bacteroidales bacterium]